MASMRSGTFIFVVLVVLVGWFFAGVLAGGMFAVRDAAHYYYPLMKYVAHEWATGHVPLWNPYQDLGVPLAGGGTAAVFYPGQLVFALPLPFDVAYRVYVLGHFAVALGAVWRLARHWGASIDAAAVAGVSYAFSGSVLFQSMNVVYLVGAAWLPLAMFVTDRALQGRAAWSIALGAVLALMILGGDPQAAYHAGLLATIQAVWVRTTPAQRRTDLQSALPNADRLPLRATVAPTLSARFAVLGFAAMVAVGLSAVQLLPMAEYLRRSERAAGIAGSVWELPRVIGGGRLGQWADAVLARGIPRGSHREHVYHYSVGPWRLAEFLWPNCGGRQFPVHRRWFEAIPGEGLVWTPSLYMGLLPLVLAISAMRLRRGDDARAQWLTWMVVLFVLGSLGWHGPGWIWNELRAAAGGDPAKPWPVGPPAGGVYWLLTIALPGYGSFRYPAKLLCVATLGLSLLAARGWDEAMAGDAARLRRWLVRLGFASLAGALGASAILPFWNGWLAGVRPSMVFGPFDPDGAAADLIGAFVQAAVISGVAAWLSGAPRRTSWARGAALALVAVDLAVANRWMVATAPAELWHRAPALAEAIDRHAECKSRAGPFRVFRRPAWSPATWHKASSPARLACAVSWHRATLQPKHHLGAGIVLAPVPDAMNLADYQTFLMAARLPGRETRPALLPRQMVLDALGAAYVILAGNEVPPEGERVRLEHAGAADPEDVSLWYNASALGRVWIVHEVQTLPPLESHDLGASFRRAQRVLDRGGRPRDFRQSAVVEAEAGTVPCDQNAEAAESLPAELCRVVRYDTDRVEIEAVLQRPGLVVLADQFYPGWHLEVASDGREPRPVPILRTNRVMRGAWLPAGHHRLVYCYRPATLACGAAVSLLAWIAMAGWAVAWPTSRTPSACGSTSRFTPWGDESPSVQGAGRLRPAATDPYGSALPIRSRFDRVHRA
jgi:hypothetical protein